MAADRMLVLVVDDESPVRTFVRSALERCGLDVVEADSGASALRIAADRVVNLLLTDIRMPEMDGFELAANLTLLAPTLPVIFMSGFTATGVPSSARFIPKPFTPAVLLRTVREALGRSVAQ